MVRCISIVVAIGVSGCVTHKVSKLGPFVKHIAAHPQGVAVDSCVVQFETTTNYTWLWLGEDVETSHELGEGPCWRTTVPTAGVP